MSINDAAMTPMPMGGPPAMTFVCSVSICVRLDLPMWLSVLGFVRAGRPLSKSNDQRPAAENTMKSTTLSLRDPRADGDGYRLAPNSEKALPFLAAASEESASPLHIIYIPELRRERNEIQHILCLFPGQRSRLVSRSRRFQERSEPSISLRFDSRPQSLH